MSNLTKNDTTEFYMFSQDGEQCVAERLAALKALSVSLNDRDSIIEAARFSLQRVKTVYPEVTDTMTMTEITLWINDNILAPQGFAPTAYRIL